MVGGRGGGGSMIASETSCKGLCHSDEAYMR